MKHIKLIIFACLVMECHALNVIGAVRFMPLLSMNTGHYFNPANKATSLAGSAMTALSSGAAAVQDAGNTVTDAALSFTSNTVTGAGNAAWTGATDTALNAATWLGSSVASKVTGGAEIVTSAMKMVTDAIPAGITAETWRNMAITERIGSEVTARADTELEKLGYPGTVIKTGLNSEIGQNYISSVINSSGNSDQLSVVPFLSGSLQKVLDSAGTPGEQAMALTMTKGVLMIVPCGNYINALLELALIIVKRREQLNAVIDKNWEEVATLVAKEIAPDSPEMEADARFFWILANKYYKKELSLADMTVGIAKHAVARGTFQNLGETVLYLSPLGNYMKILNAAAQAVQILQTPRSIDEID